MLAGLVAAGSTGHPVEATGAILSVKAAYDLRRTGGELGIAIVIEAIGKEAA